jgi:hypothetical protein
MLDESQARKNDGWEEALKITRAKAPRTCPRGQTKPDAVTRR